MRIAVVAAGALGGYLGARLAQSGEEVHLVARGAHLARMRQAGLTVHSVFGDIALPADSIRATDDPNEIGPVDVVLFTVKSFDTEVAAALLPPLLDPMTAVISLQNGVSNEEQLAARIGPDHVVGGVAYVLTGIAEPGVVRHSGGPTTFAFGEMDGRPSARLEAFLAVCRTAGLTAQIVPDIRSALWTKYAFICAQAGLTAATRLPIGAVRTSSPTWALFRRVLEEVERVGHAEGIALPADLVERQLSVAQAMEPSGYASLYDDLVAGRRLELEALHGDLVRRAQRAGLEAPVCTVIYGLLAPWAEGRDQGREAVR
jgi:2-dehydropantoate 2-reductase